MDKMPFHKPFLILSFKSLWLGFADKDHGSSSFLGSEILFKYKKLIYCPDEFCLPLFFQWKETVSMACIHGQQTELNLLFNLAS